MSEYQYYEFAAVDEPLTEKQFQEVRALSTRAEITSTRFFNEYHFGNFKGDPRKMMKQYYDAFFYYADWGTIWCMIRVPRELADLKTWKEFAVDDAVEIRSEKNFVIVEIVLDEESGEHDLPMDHGVEDVIAARNALLQGDVRPLYLAWLAAVDYGYVDDDVNEPCDGTTLERLSGPLNRFADLLRIPKAMRSKAFGKGNSGQTLTGEKKLIRDWIQSLAAEEKDKLLEQLLGEGSERARAKALKEFRATRPDQPAVSAGQRMASVFLTAAGEERTQDRARHYR